MIFNGSDFLAVFGATTWSCTKGSSPAARASSAAAPQPRTKQPARNRLRETATPHGSDVTRSTNNLRICRSPGSTPPSRTAP